MSLSGALNVALTGLQTSTTAVQVISGNVSNAHTVGYTEKTVNLESISAGSSLGGVAISGYSRVTDAVLSTTLNNATSAASYLSTQNGYMSQVQSILDSTDDPPALSADLSNFQAAWTQYAASPSDVTLQKSLVAAGQVLAATVGTISSATSTLETNVKTDLSTTVGSLNTALSNIQTLNNEITTAQSDGQPTVDLQDERDQAVSQVSQYCSVTVMPRQNGQVALYTTSGVPLVDGPAQVFSVNPNGDGIVNNVGGDVTGALSGGTLQAQTDFLSTSTSTANGVGVIDKIQSQLTAFANMFVSPATGGFADTYDNSATGSSGELASSFFTASTDANGNITDLSSFAVNAALVAGTSTVKSEVASNVSNTFTASNLAINTGTTPPSTSTTFTANGLTATNQTYGGIATAILSGFQQQANAIKSQTATASSQQAYYQNTLSSETGVNTDTELVNLTNWENSYSASAHVISTIQSMMQTLEGIIQ